MKCDLVLVKYDNDGATYVFQAPYISCLKKGDLVKVEGGNKFATVVGHLNISDYDNDEYKFITQMNGVTLPLKKVIAKVKLSEYSYEEGINE